MTGRAALLAAVWLALAASALATPALAQDAPGDPQAAPPASASPDPAAPDQNAPDQPAPAPKPPPTPTPEPPAPSWQPHQTGVLQMLDKVDGQSSTLLVQVGQKQVYHGITVDLRACFARPPDQAQDSAAYLIITDSDATAPAFVGWMLANEPAASMMQHPVYDVRVLGCR